VLSGPQKLLRFHRGLPEFLATPLSGERCGAILEQSLRHREENLLRVLRMAVYENRRSPYLPLLHRAGAELGDVFHESNEGDKAVLKFMIYEEKTKLDPELWLVKK